MIKALNEPPRDRKKTKNIKHSGNVPFSQIVDIARTLRPRSMAKELKGTVKEILGTAQSVGCLIDGMSATDCLAKVSSGEIEVPVRILSLCRGSFLTHCCLLGQVKSVHFAAGTMIFANEILSNPNCLHCPRHIFWSY